MLYIHLIFPKPVEYNYEKKCLIQKIIFYPISTEYIFKAFLCLFFLNSYGSLLAPHTFSE